MKDRRLMHCKGWTIEEATNLQNQRYVSPKNCLSCDVLLSTRLGFEDTNKYYSLGNPVKEKGDEGSKAR